MSESMIVGLTFMLFCSGVFTWMSLGMRRINIRFQHIDALLQLYHSARWAELQRSYLDHAHGESKLSAERIGEVSEKLRVATADLERRRLEAEPTFALSDKKFGLVLADFLKIFGADREPFLVKEREAVKAAIASKS